MLRETEYEGLQNSACRKKKKLDPAKIVMFEAVVGQVVFASKDELTVDAVDLVERTLDVVVLSDVVPRWEILEAVFTKRVRQLVVIVIRV